MANLTPVTKRAKCIQTSAWTSINSLVSISSNLSDSTLSEHGSIEHDLEDDDSQNSSPAASKHRAAILEAATRLTTTRKKPPRKRKVGGETSRPVIKKSKRNVQIESEILSSDSEFQSNIDTRSSVQTSDMVQQPVKRYLQPTKSAKLNESVGVTIAPQSKRSSLIKTDPINAGNNDSDGENAVCTQLEDNGNQTSLSTMYANFPPKVASDYENHSPTEEENFMDTDIDDLFEHLPDLTIEDSTNRTPHEARQPGSFSIDTSSPVSPMSTTLSPFPSQTPKFRPFLRSAFEDPVPTIKYSPIPRIMPTLKITTCFRIAEALRMLKSSTDSNVAGQRTTIELFALVVDMSIDHRSNTQTFKFADLFFPDRPPYLSGTGRGLTSTNIIHFLFDKVVKYKNSATAQKSQNMDNVLCRAIISASASDDLTSSNSTVAFGSPDHLHMRHVRVEALRESDRDEVQYVRGIVDPDGVEAEQQKEKEKTMQQQM